MSQVMQRLLRPCKPVYDVCAPSWIIKLPGVTLYPLTIYVDAAGPELVLQVQVICCNAIVPAFAGWLGIGLDLPG